MRSKYRDLSPGPVRPLNARNMGAVAVVLQSVAAFACWRCWLADELKVVFSPLLACGVPAGGVAGIVVVVVVVVVAALVLSYFFRYERNLATLPTCSVAMQHSGQPRVYTLLRYQDSRTMTDGFDQCVVSSLQA